VDVKLITVITTALVDSINPCAIGVLVLLISTLLALTHNKKRMMFVGLVYLSVVYITYFLAGLGLLYFIQKLAIADGVAITAGILVIILGIIEIKDFYWYGRGISLTIPKSQIGRIKRYAEKASIPGVVLLGMLVAAVELPCTGGPYLAITSLLAKDFDWIAFWYLALYNFIFVLPLLVILIAVYTTLTVAHIDAWKGKYKKWMRLVSGLVMVALGIVLILYANGDINLG